MRVLFFPSIAKNVCGEYRVEHFSRRRRGEVGEIEILKLKQDI
jgi:hypothetical protein